MNGKQSVINNSELVNCFKRETIATELEGQFDGVGHDNEMIGEALNPEEHADWGAIPSNQLPNDRSCSGG